MEREEDRVEPVLELKAKTRQGKRPGHRMPMLTVVEMIAMGESRTSQVSGALKCDEGLVNVALSWRGRTVKFPISKFT